MHEPIIGDVVGGLFVVVLIVKAIELVRKKSGAYCVNLVYDQ